MIVGFTGSRSGITSGQLHTFRSFLLEHLSDIEEFHRGSCVGADVKAHHEAYNLGVPIYIHPPINRDFYADVEAEATAFYKAKKYLQRNRDIVLASDIVVVMPRGDSFSPRSGTYYTFELTVNSNKPAYVIWGDKTPEWFRP